MSDRLSRLLYLGDVPVESSYHGSALLYRLLQTYPPHLLKIVEGSLGVSARERRLKDVEYHVLDFGKARLLNTRLHEWYSLWLSCTSEGVTREVPPLLDGFQPEAVLTVAHGHLWVTAARFAERHGLPLHLIVHDDWPRTVRLPRGFASRVDRQFRRVYLSAAARLCVSPSIVEEYRRRYGVDGQVLYPSRAQDGRTFARPPERLRETSDGPVFAFAGTLNVPDYSRLLRALAECLERHNGRVMIFGPITTADAASMGLDRRNVQLCGLLQSNLLIDRLRAEADALFVPMSFGDRDRANMEMGFPSKLADYTSVGVPLLIVGPPYCSAVRWAVEHLGVAEVINSDDPGELGRAIQRLADPQHRMRLAEAAMSVGDRLFSPVVARSQLQNALLRRRIA